MATVTFKPIQVSVVEEGAEVLVADLQDEFGEFKQEWVDTLCIELFSILTVLSMYLEQDKFKSALLDAQGRWLEQLANGRTTVPGETRH